MATPFFAHENKVLLESFGLSVEDVELRYKIYVSKGMKKIAIEPGYLDVFIDDLVEKDFKNLKKEYTTVDNIVSVQPMEAPTGQIFTLKTRYTR